MNIINKSNEWKLSPDKLEKALITVLFTNGDKIMSITLQNHSSNSLIVIILYAKSISD